MLRELIVPVGTSMLTNWMPRIDPNAKISAAWLAGAASETANASPPLLEKAWIPRFKEAMRKGTGRTSAEIDSIRRWLAKQQGVQVSRVTLLVSDTPPAKWVASVLQALLPDVFNSAITVESKPILRLKPDDMHEGLVEFIRVSAAAIKASQKRGAQPVVNATPGFKAETSLLTLLGALLGAETVYLHEHMQDIVTVPVIPLRWELEQGDINLLRQVSNCASRDEVRELGIGAHPVLWSFLNREGHGSDEIWGLSALGQIVVESSSDNALEEIDEREKADADFIVATKEKGHMPADAEQLAREISKRFSFVKLVKVTGWTPWKPQGLLNSRESDSEEGIVRVRLQSSANDELLIVFLLQTTASNQAQWRMARQRIGDAFGRVSLIEELREAEGQDLDTTRSGDTPQELSQLRVEELLQAELNRSETRVRNLTEQIAVAAQNLEHANRQIGGLNKELSVAAERRRRQEELLKQNELELQGLQSTVDSLRAELVAATSGPFAGEAVEGSPDK